MTDEQRPISEFDAAKETLLVIARRVGDALPAFTSWLLAGMGAAFTLVLANVDTVSKFVAIANIKFGAIVFLLSLAVAVLATQLAAIIKATLASLDDAELFTKKLLAQAAPFDVNVYI